MTFNEQLDAFVADLTAKFGGKEHGTSHFALAGGSKFIRIASVGYGDSRSAYAFVAAEDGSNKKLGDYSQGDVFKPDGWKGPAKHARGNIFSHRGGTENCGEYSVAYLK